MLFAGSITRRGDSFLTAEVNQVHLLCRQRLYLLDHGIKATVNHRVTLLGAFGKPFQHRIADALDFKAVFRRTNAVC
jgi:hypothetical protein